MDPLESPPTPRSLTHFDSEGRARMVDVGTKDQTHRIAVASARVRMQPETAAQIRDGRATKGDVLGIAQVAAIMAAKRTPDLVPLCHPLLLTRVEAHLDLTDTTVEILARVETRGQTGVEMEALTAASVGALTVYDMVKAIDRGMVIEHVRLESKDGGQSGSWQRPGR